MNTSKQINAMIVLMALLLIGVGIYTLWDPFRADAEVDRTKEAIARRAGKTFSKNCAQCHGEAGEGRIGPALAPAARKASGLLDFSDPDRRSEFAPFVRNTITCGRIGKIMPAWAVEQGGSLNAEQIRQLVILITENPGGNAWEKVGEISREEHKDNPLPSVEDILKSNPTITGAANSVCGQPPLSASSPTPTPTPPPVSTSLTQNATDNKFGDTAFAVPANQQVTLTFNNRGQAVHNFHVLNVKDKDGKDVDTTLINAGQSRTITFTFDKTGAYNFQCDVHPQDMKGILFVQ